MIRKSYSLRLRHGYDFGDIRALANLHLVNKWDHAFIVYENESMVRAFLESLPDHKTVVFDRVPTVENLALTKVTLYETPNCWAEVDG